MMTFMGYLSLTQASSLPSLSTVLFLQENYQLPNHSIHQFNPTEYINSLRIMAYKSSTMYLVNLQIYWMFCVQIEECCIIVVQFIGMIWVPCLVILSHQIYEYFILVYFYWNIFCCVCWQSHPFAFGLNGLLSANSFSVLCPHFYIC